MGKPAPNKVADEIRAEFCLYKQNIEEKLAGFQQKIDRQEEDKPTTSSVSSSELRLDLEDLKTAIRKEIDIMNSSLEARLTRIEDNLDEA
jgi:hypothetical protein